MIEIIQASDNWWFDKVLVYLFVCLWILTEWPSSFLHHPKDFRCCAQYAVVVNSEMGCFDGPSSALCWGLRSSAPDTPLLDVICLTSASLWHPTEKVLFIQLLQLGNLRWTASILGSVWLLSQYGTLLLSAFQCWSSVVAIGNHSPLLTCSHYVAEVLNTRWKCYLVVIGKQYIAWASQRKIF